MPRCRERGGRCGTIRWCIGGLPRDCWGRKGDGGNGEVEPEVGKRRVQMMLMSG